MKMYILKDGKPFQIDEKDPQALLEYAKWMGTAGMRTVGKTHLKDGAFVSTVFLGIDHNFFPEEDPRPVLWETMIFGGKYDQYQWRYMSEEEAKEGHKYAVKLAKNEVDPKETDSPG